MLVHGVCAAGDGGGAAGPSPRTSSTNAWAKANRAAHKELLTIINGGTNVVSTKQGVVTLNLNTLVSQLATTLGIQQQVVAAQSKLRGSAGASARKTAQQKLGNTLPPSSGQLVIMRSAAADLLDDWVRAEAEARRTYAYWTSRRDADSYAVYRACADRADAAQDALAHGSGRGSARW